MNCVRGDKCLSDFREDPGSLHLAIGIFDGVHIGHQAILRQAVAAAVEAGGKSMAVTFWPHPSHILRPQAPTQLLIDRHIRSRLLRNAGIDEVAYAEITQEFSRKPAKEFPAYLKDQLPSLKSISVGEGFRFGHERRGDVELFQHEGSQLGLQIHSVPRVEMDAVPLSSSLIREKLKAGEVSEANRMLGFPYFAEGTLVSGMGLGREMGVPTLNLDWSPELQPRLGVYAVRMSFSELSGHSFAGVANYGCRPTVEAGQDVTPVLEVHLLEGLANIPGGSVEVAFHQFIRPERRFPSVEELAKRIEKDVAIAKTILAHT